MNDQTSSETSAILPGEVRSEIVDALVTTLSAVEWNLAEKRLPDATRELAAMSGFPLSVFPASYIRDVADDLTRMQSVRDRGVARAQDLGLRNPTELVQYATTRVALALQDEAAKPSIESVRPSEVALRLSRNHPERAKRAEAVLLVAYGVFGTDDGTIDIYTGRGLDHTRRATIALVVGAAAGELYRFDGTEDQKYSSELVKQNGFDVIQRVYPAAQLDGPEL